MRDHPDLGLIIAMKQKRKKMDEEDGSMHEDMASDIIDAVKSGDARELAETLADFIHACSRPYENEEEQE
jgi:DNA-binding GntR family transcriptional regulator